MKRSDCSVVGLCIFWHSQYWRWQSHWATFKCQPSLILKPDKRYIVENDDIYAIRLEFATKC